MEWSSYETLLIYDTKNNYISNEINLSDYCRINNINSYPRAYIRGSNLYEHFHQPKLPLIFLAQHTRTIYRSFIAKR